MIDLLSFVGRLKLIEKGNRIPINSYLSLAKTITVIVTAAIHKRKQALT